MIRPFCTKIHWIKSLQTCTINIRLKLLFGLVMTIDEMWLHVVFFKWSLVWWWSIIEHNFILYQMSARRRRRSNSNSKDESNGSPGYSELQSSTSTMTMTSSSSVPSMQFQSNSQEAGCRDRTMEFRSVVLSMRSNKVNSCVYILSSWLVYILKYITLQLQPNFSEKIISLGACCTITLFPVLIVLKWSEGLELLGLATLEYWAWVLKIQKLW